MGRWLGTARALVLLACAVANVAATTARAGGYPDHGRLQPCTAKWAAPTGPVDADKILAVPNLTGPYDHRRCDVSAMSIAIRDNGELRNIYMTDSDGRKIPDGRLSPPAQDQDRLRDRAVESLEGRIGERVADLVAAARRAGQDPSDYLRKNPVKVLIYTHGGRVSQQGAVLGAEALAPMMMRDGYVPLFLIWNSDDIIAYTDHLCCVRKGSVDADKGFNKWFSIPTRLFSDVGSSVATAPENYFQQVTRFKESVIDKNYDLYALNYDDPAEDCAYFDPDPKLKYRKRPVSTVCQNIVFPDFRSAPSDDQKHLLNGGSNNKRFKDDALYTVGFLPRIVTTAALSQVGAQEWDNLVRRTRLGFDNESTRVAYPVQKVDFREKDCHDGSDLRRIDEPLTCPKGAFTLFFNAISPDFADLDQGDATVADVPCDKLGACEALGPGTTVPVTFEYYGHSMGAIVGDELISRYPGLPWSRIIYMAAADTIREFKHMFTLAIDSTPQRTRLRFYSLSLHPIAESRERVFHGFLPQGSLLEWIDEMFNRPRTGDDRTLGKWKNVEMSLPTWRADLLDRMTFRVFPAQNNLDGPGGAKAETDLFSRECDRNPAPGETGTPVICHPVGHGEFTTFSFWRQMYLTGTTVSPLTP